MQRKKPGMVRIIGGEWRGRRLPVPDIVGLRPSGDRSRETLFNWLQPHLHQARCVDLFAGTGVLGLEAASRGAASVVLVEKSQLAADALCRTVELLRAKQVTVVEADSMTWLAQQAARQVAPAFDIAFVDPPFGTSLATAALEHLSKRECLSPRGLVYLESARAESGALIGPEWELVREKILGEVRMQLVRKSPHGPSFSPDPT